jgi:putative ABC transport system permease protein
MVQLFAERLSEVRAHRGALAGWVHCVRESADVVKTALVLWRTRRGRDAGSTARASGGWALDLRHALRLWGRRPGLTLLVLVVIGLGIGTTSTMFTVVDGVLLRPLPHRDPDALVRVSQTLRSQNGARVPVSYPNLLDLGSASGSGLAGLAGYQVPHVATVALGAEPEALVVDGIGGTLLSVLGNGVKLGRGIGPSDDVPGAHVALLSEGLWRSRYGGDASVLGRLIRIEGRPYEVVGVMPAEFAFPSQVDIWVALGLDPATAERDTRSLQAVGRLAPGVSLPEAQRRLGAVMVRLEAEYPAENAGNGIELERLRDVVLGGARRASPAGSWPLAMRVLLGAVGLLLVLVCATVANLLLARVSARSGELALRGALGADRRRIVQQLGLEHLLLAVVGGLLGLGVAWLGTKLMVGLTPASLPRREAIRLDGRGVLFAGGVTLLSAVLFGLLPAWWATSRRAGSLLGRGYRWASAPADRLLRGLVVVQLAIALVLLIGGGLLVRSFLRLSSVDPGFEPDGVFTMRVTLPARYDTADRVRTFFAESWIARPRCPAWSGPARRGRFRSVAITHPAGSRWRATRPRPARSPWWG